MSKRKYFNLFSEDEDDDSIYSNPRSYNNNGGGGYGNGYSGHSNYSGRYGGNDYSYIYGNESKNTKSVIKQGLSYWTAKNVNENNTMNGIEDSRIDYKKITMSLPTSMNFFGSLQDIIQVTMNSASRYSGFLNSDNLHKSLLDYLVKIGIDKTKVAGLSEELRDGSYPYNFNQIDKVYTSGAIANISSEETAKGFVNNILSLMIKDLDDCIRGEFVTNSSFTGNHSNYMVAAKAALNTMYYAFVTFNKFIDKDDVEMFGQDYFKNFNKDEVDYQIKEDNSWWFNILSNTDNYIMKMLTKGNDMSSNIVSNNMTQAVCKSIYRHVSKKLEADPNYSPEDFKNDCGGQGGGQGEGDPEGGEGQSQSKPGSGQMDSDFKNDLAQNAEQAMDQSREQIKDKNSAMNMLGVDPAKATPEELKDVESILKEIDQVRLDKNDVERFVKQSIKNFNSSFRGQKHIMEESFLDADEVDDLRDLHLLVDLSLIDDMAVNVNRYSMKYNLYVDCSGSMSSLVTMSEKNKNEKQSSLRRITLAKILAYKMNKMNLLNDIYAFETHVHETPVKNIINQLRAGGGTSIDSVMDHINEHNIPSVILSDGDDEIYTDSNRAYVFTISSTCGGPVMNKLAAQGRAVHFENGQFINYEVNAQGDVFVDRKKVRY